MKKRYEALFALDTRGKEESAKDIIDRIEKELADSGASVEQTQRLEKRELAYEHNHLKQAYYVNFVIETEPSKIVELREKFKLDADVMLQNYLVLPVGAAAV
ncbi:MAG: 30S ribosomal protein S6 [Chthoniobacterales bacterium]